MGKPGRPSLGPYYEVRGRLHPDTYDTAKELADIRGIPMAELIRQAVTTEVAASKEEIAAARALADARAKGAERRLRAKAS